MIALVDYKAGNLTSVKKALAAIGAEVVVPETPDQITEASGVIVPGVGHFGATRALDAPWIEAILGRIGEGRPLLGICLGMPWLFEGSDEAPDLAGLGLLSGRCYARRCWCLLICTTHMRRWLCPISSWKIGSRNVRPNSSN